MWKLGVCEKDLNGSLAENVQWLAEHGFSGLQLWKNKLDGEGLSAADGLKMIGDAGLEVTSIGGGPNMVDPSMAEQNIALFKTFLDLSVEMGPGIVCAESKAKPEGMTDEQAWDSTVHFVTEVCRHAESAGAVLAIECAGPCFITDHDMWLELQRRVGSQALKVNLDPANIVWAGKKAEDAVRALGANIVHTHAKDIARVEDDALHKREHLMDVPAGKGLVDYPEYLRALAETGYDGYLVIEMHSGDQDRRADVVESMENLQEMMAELG
ncbi:MAG: sugar phosphate isomerase/epimerase family protein [Planctomycetota bacterium]